MENYTRLLTIVAFTMGLLFYGCNKSRFTIEEKEIFANNFATQILYFAPAFENQEMGDSLISIINLTAIDARENFSILTSKDKLINLANDIISNENIKKLNQDSGELREFIHLNFNDFKSKRMSLIQEYDYTNKIFQFYYWKNWKCDLGRGYSFTSHSLDTLLLYEFQDYTIPISLNSEDNHYNPYRIVSNSLQVNNKNSIQIKTGKAKKGVFVKEVELQILNIISGERIKQKESIKYRVIRRDSINFDRFD